jgi:multimeric flavodoxin WrbA
MKKTYLIIKGSGRKDGYISRICNELQESLKAQNVIVYDTYKENPAPCDGCNYCEIKGECSKRDMDDFYKVFEECDTIIFLSPVYNGSFPSPLKSVLDRFQVYYTSFYKNNKTQPIIKRREAYLITAAGRDGIKATEYMKSQLNCAFTILNVELKGTFLCAHTDTAPDYDGVVNEIKRSLCDD